MQLRIALVCLLVLLIGVSPSAHAQLGFPMIGMSHWDITYEAHGLITTKARLPSGYLLDIPDQKIDIHPGDTPPGAYSIGGLSNPIPPPCVSATVSYSCSITVTLQWNDGLGGSTNPPRGQIYLLQTANAAWSATGNSSGSYQGTADDGLGDACTSLPMSGSSTGKHLIQQDGSTGHISYTIAPKRFRISVFFLHHRRCKRANLMGRRRFFRYARTLCTPPECARRNR